MKQVLYKHICFQAAFVFSLDIFTLFNLSSLLYLKLQPFISFQSLPETPDNDTCNTVINENPGTSAAHNSQNSNKRLFKDVTVSYTFF